MDLSAEFTASIYRRTFRITVEARSRNEQGGINITEHTGTGFCFAVLSKSRRGLVATARHVLTDVPENSDLLIRFERFTEEDKLDSIASIKSKTDATDRPFGFYKFSDVGYIYLPVEDDANRPLFGNTEMGLPVLAENKRIIAGSWLGWAGFPSQVEALLRHPHLC
ncbi:MAG: hypothetical protein AABZ08_00050, partial [Planctomycetota bacterium]